MREHRDVRQGEAVRREPFVLLEIGRNAAAGDHERLGRGREPLRPEAFASAMPQRPALGRQTLEPSARALGRFAAERSPTSNCELGSNVRLDVFAPFLHPITLARIAAAERWIGIGFFEIEQDEEALA